MGGYFKSSSGGLRQGNETLFQYFVRLQNFKKIFQRVHLEEKLNRHLQMMNRLAAMKTIWGNFVCVHICIFHCERFLDGG